MKKSHLAVAVAATALAPAAVMAQSNVTLYGILDTGVTWVDNGASSTGLLSTGVVSTSRFGVRGVEDLGGGLKGIFGLESGINSDTGGQRGTTPTGDGPSPNRLFDRMAVVGVEGTFGQLRIGRDTTPTYNAGSQIDTLGLGYWGNSLGWSYATSRIDNGVFYKSPTIAGFYGEIAANFGDSTLSTGQPVTPPSGITESITEPSNVGRYSGLRLAYQAGPISANAAYGQINTTSVDTTREVAAGGAYDFGMFRLGVGYYQRRPEGVGDTKAVNVGGSVKLGVGTVLAQVYQIRTDLAAGSDPRANVFALAYNHPLSKRTALFASFGSASNNSAGLFSLRSASETIAPSSAGEDPRAFSMGVRHTF